MCLRKASDSRTVVRESDMLGFNQELLRGAFMARADRVHNGKRQTRNQPFLSLNIPIRKQEIY